MMTILFANIPTDLLEEVCETLLDTDSVRVERIVSHGHGSSDDLWFDQQQHEWVVVRIQMALLPGMRLWPIFLKTVEVNGQVVKPTFPRWPEPGTDPNSEQTPL